MSVIKAYFRLSCASGLIMRHGISTPLIYVMKCSSESDIAFAALWQRKVRHDIVQGEQLCIMDSLIELHCSFKKTFRLETYEHCGIFKKPKGRQAWMRNNMANFEVAFNMFSTLNDADEKMFDRIEQRQVSMLDPIVTTMIQRQKSCFNNIDYRRCVQSRRPCV